MVIVTYTENTQEGLIQKKRDHIKKGVVAHAREGVEVVRSDGLIESIVVYVESCRSWQKRCVWSCRASIRSADEET